MTVEAPSRLRVSSVVMFLVAIAIVAVVVATIVIGLFGVRVSRTTSDFLVASRSVSPRNLVRSGIETTRAVARTSRKSLRLLGSVGEPINPEEIGRAHV